VEEQTVTLKTLAKGAALELFDREMDAVVANIADVNTNPKAKREINIKVIIQPDENRGLGVAALQVTSKLAAVKPVGALLYFGRDRTGKAVAVSNDFTQPGIFDTQKSNIVPLTGIPGGKEGA
jgi:hypothetical protein